jgi:ATP synthase F1 delta subunit
VIKPSSLVGRELGDLAATFESDRELRDFFARPWTPPTVKRTVAMEVAQRSDLSKLASDFMSLVAGRGRTDYIEAIAARYEKLVDEHLGRVRARVRTAVPLTDEGRRTLSAKIGQTLGSRQVLLEDIVDPTMLGGFVVESGGVVVGRQPGGSARADTPPSHERPGRRRYSADTFVEPAWRCAGHLGSDSHRCKGHRRSGRTTRKATGAP